MARRVDHPYAAILHSHADYVTNAIFSLHLADVANPHAVTKAQVGLGNADNTSDASKPVSTAQQTALNLKANIASPTFTGTVGGITAAMVGLGNVNNTSDASKPVSTAQQTALDLKANLASPTFTGTVVLPSGQTITLPTIASFVNATHNHQAAAGGGTLDAAAITAGVLGTARLASTGTPSATTFLRGDQSWSIPAGGGDVAGPAASVDSEISIFSGTTGKILKRATTTGLLKASSGVLAAATAGTDYYNPGGTDVAVADGGTGASTAATALTNLGALAKAGDTATGQVDFQVSSTTAAVPIIANNPSIANNVTKTSAILFRGRDTVSTVKDTAQVLATPTDANWTAGSLGLFYRTGDALVQGLNLSASGPLFPVLAGVNTGTVQVSSAGLLQRNDLSGTGSRTVIASSTGVLSAPAGQPAWTMINDATFVTAGSVSVNSVFNNTYDNYMIQLRVNDSSVAGNILLRLRVGGVDSSTGVYDWCVWFVLSSAATVNGASGAAGTSFLVGACGGTAGENYSTIFIGNPALVKKTVLTFQSGNWSTPSTVHQAMHGGGGHRNVTAYDGFTIIPASGNITGNVKTYGLRNNL